MSGLPSLPPRLQRLSVFTTPTSLSLLLASLPGFRSFRPSVCGISLWAVWSLPSISSLQYEAFEVSSFLPHALPTRSLLTHLWQAKSSSYHLFPQAKNPGTIRSTFLCPPAGSDLKLGVRYHPPCLYPPPHRFSLQQTQMILGQCKLYCALFQNVLTSLHFDYKQMHTMVCVHSVESSANCNVVD